MRVEQMNIFARIAIPFKSLANMAKFCRQLFRGAKRQSSLIETYDQALEDTCGMTGIPLDVQVRVRGFSVDAKNNSIFGLFY